MAGLFIIHVYKVYVCNLFVMYNIVVFMSRLLHIPPINKYLEHKKFNIQLNNNFTARSLNTPNITQVNICAVWSANEWPGLLLVLQTVLQKLLCCLGTHCFEKMCLLAI